MSSELTSVSAAEAATAMNAVSATPEAERVAGLEATIAALQAELAEARNECLEQARLLGMSAERELDMQSRLAEARMGQSVRIAELNAEVMGLHRELDEARDRALEEAAQEADKWFPADTASKYPKGGIAAAIRNMKAAAIEARDWSK